MPTLKGADFTKHFYILFTFLVQKDKLRLSALFEQYTAMLIDWQGCGFDLVSNDLMWCLYGFIKVNVYSMDQLTI
jgi:hypothetical protein